MKFFLLTHLLMYSLFAQDHWETAIFSYDQWKYKVPLVELPSSWKNIEFDDDIWNENVGGFGYADNDDGTIIDATISVYLRKLFSVSNKSKLSRAVLSADYDDGFVAYINGIEIGRSYNLSEPGSFVSYDQTTEYDHEATMYDNGFPENFIIDSLKLDSVLVQGTNVLAIQVHNVDITSSDMSSNFFLTFGIVDDSQFFSPTPDWFQEPISFEESNLPIVIVNTYGENIPDEPRIPAYMGIIDNESGTNNINDIFNEYDGHITIERRGNSSQWQDKPPYRFETVDSEGENYNVELLGMPEENDWVLYAPWQDKTMIRNVLAYQLSNEIGRYASKTRHIELFINEEYQGVYVLMEKIKRDRNRVDISTLNPHEISGDDVTGGYILKFDWYYTGDNIGGFESGYDGMTYNYHYPKPSDIVPEQETYIQNYIANFEDVMLNPDYSNDSTGYPSMINIESFIDFILLQELAKNVDAYRLSTYIYKDKESIDNRLFAGPIWDFNHGFGNCDYGETWEIDNWLLEYNPEGGDQMAFWWELLWQDENFQLKTAERYTELRETIFSENFIYSIIDSVVSELGESVNRNFIRWPILGTYIWPNYYVFDSYDDEVNYLKSWISDRLLWMDGQMLLLDIDKSEISSEYKITSIYPNPFNPIANIQYKLIKDSYVDIRIYDVFGNVVKELLSQKEKPGMKLIKWNATNDLGYQVSTGVYLFDIQIDNNYRQTRKIMFLK